MPTEYAADRIGTDELPSAIALLRAFREPDDPNRHRHRVLSVARELVECHERRHNALQAAHAPNTSSAGVAQCLQLVDDLDLHRTELIHCIDSWVATNVQHRAGASLHTETLGAVIDRMASKWVAAQRALGMSAPVDPPHPLQLDDDAQLQWSRLAELADGYRDLITDVAEHRRRLPVW
ncbi:DUF4254 domain-containing protein [Nocardia sp. NBC_00565]|uniref:DUF4254 domain-containing protein n=1 Tax=Nocardia sp. NBC_00565 TaxID=2975993 RepID=UPI002E819E36|nr:DUF4254 domain-containing protein [Nocardia sp. NBC_00565]WUC03562.1 DUF4254 domain-containing protein [Nocardia sp. NBC_00565]